MSDQWIVWCGFNSEQDLICQRLEEEGISYVSVEGKLSTEEKETRLHQWLAGSVKVLVTKISILGFGMNLQNCSKMIFVGIGDSYEQYYQAIRRCYRFGQTDQVKVHIILSEPEQVVFDNVKRKEIEAQTVSSELIANIASFEKDEIMSSQKETSEYQTDDRQGENWKLLLGDSVERLRELDKDSIDLSVFSPPFSTLFTYSNSDRDLGNSRDNGEFFTHFSYITEQLYRVLRPGRIACVHVQQIATMKVNGDPIGVRDFRGQMIAHFIEHGFVYQGEICIDKDPQATAIRTHTKGLAFNQLHKDAAWMRPTFADYILLLRKPGDNPTPIISDVSNDEWIEWARPIWYGIKESDTLNVAAARSEDDERHICPLQLGTIERCVRLWSNSGETVLSPFAGIGSEGYQSLKSGRKFIGIELKPEYFNQAVKNLQTVEIKLHQPTLFDLIQEG